LVSIEYNVLKLSIWQFWSHTLSEIPIRSLILISGRMTGYPMLFVFLSHPKEWRGTNYKWVKDRIGTYST
jgi:hypothetical protein